MELFRHQIQVLVSQGYRLAAAQAKVAHDAILLAMNKCGFKSHSTIKGGVVMSHITNDIRRTTMENQGTHPSKKGDKLKIGSNFLIN